MDKSLSADSEIVSALMLCVGIFFVHIIFASFFSDAIHNNFAIFFFFYFDVSGTLVDGGMLLCNEF